MGLHSATCDGDGRAPCAQASASDVRASSDSDRKTGAFRGRPARDRRALVSALVHLAAFAAAHPEVAECDVNPLLVLDEGQGCVAVDVRVRVTG